MKIAIMFHDIQDVRCGDLAGGPGVTVFPMRIFARLPYLHTLGAILARSGISAIH
ncbi:hypothetical protein AB0G04_08525 [Actinoplanes sp. NPDC023801]|uniref:hypothetical protein n=1 Tax=Actinoplanes sp. NPDC023801 TaxID=3154595 RepID=UPI00340E63D9